MTRLILLGRHAQRFTPLQTVEAGRGGSDTTDESMSTTEIWRIRRRTDCTARARSEVMPGLIVILAMLTMAIRPAGADDDPPARARKPFIAYSWSPDPEKSHDNIFPFYWLRVGRDLADPSMAKEATDTMPQGHRVLFSWDMHNDILSHPEDCCRTPDGTLTEIRGVWWDKGVERAAARFDDFFGRYKRMGGRVDTVVLDFEETFNNFWMNREANRWDAVRADPRFEAIANELGFDDLESVRNWRSGDDYNKWNALMHRRRTDYINTALYAPIRKHFPDVKMSNWECFYNSPKCKCPTVWGHQFSRYSNGAHVGSHQSLHLYGVITTLTDCVYSDGEFRRTGVGPRYTTTPFDAFRLNVNRMRTMVLSSDVPTMPWIDYRAYPTSLLANHDLYQETILHAGLCNPDVFLFWNPNGWRADQNPEDFNTPLQVDYVDRCLKELDQLVGHADRRTLVRDLEYWFGDYVLTGMQAGRRNVWRLTPNVPESDLSKVVVTTDPPVFRIGNNEVRFTAGRIIRPAKPVSGLGFWVTAEPSVHPEIVRLTVP